MFNALGEWLQHEPSGAVSGGVGSHSPKYIYIYRYIKKHQVHLGTVRRRRGSKKRRNKQQLTVFVEGAAGMLLCFPIPKGVFFKVCVRVHLCGRPRGHIRDTKEKIKKIQKHQQQVFSLQKRPCNLKTATIKRFFLIYYLLYFSVLSATPSSRADLWSSASVATSFLQRATKIMRDEAVETEATGGGSRSAFYCFFFFAIYSKNKQKKGFAIIYYFLRDPKVWAFIDVVEQSSLEYFCLYKTF